MIATRTQNQYAPTHLFGTETRRPKIIQKSMPFLIMTCLLHIYLRSFAIIGPQNTSSYTKKMNNKRGNKAPLCLKRRVFKRRGVARFPHCHHLVYAAGAWGLHATVYFGAGVDVFLHISYSTSFQKRFMESRREWKKSVCLELCSRLPHEGIFLFLNQRKVP